MAKTQLEQDCHRFTLAKVLVNGATFSPQLSTYFRILPNENQTYGALFMQMTRAMIRKTKGHDLLFNFDSTNAQRSSLETLIDTLEASAKEKDMEITLLEAVAAYQAFSWSLVHIPEPRCQTNWSSPI
ncbi:hypothetical protein JVT61DRAFT_3953 [Boletus reticuloceps]|uniref:Uncharacterized protein n=1 Tax=Boletus reticuloceps TaxID=495285 RepID=A0A8I2YMI1_9AGAM|nr:hypothetical protein JVT61DRAFT_3953 [Boletus reticuloceps]